MIAFLYTTINSIQLSEKKARRRRIAYVSHQREKYLSLYEPIINEESKNEREKQIVLAVMIYEGLNRPKFMQFIERLLLPTECQVKAEQVLITLRAFQARLKQDIGFDGWSRIPVRIKPALAWHGA